MNKSNKEEKCDCPTKYCSHYESDFDRFLKEHPPVLSETELDPDTRIEGQAIRKALESRIIKSDKQ